MFVNLMELYDIKEIKIKEDLNKFYRGNNFNMSMFFLSCFDLKLT